MSAQAEPGTAEPIYADASGLYVCGARTLRRFAPVGVPGEEPAPMPLWRGEGRFGDIPVAFTFDVHAESPEAAFGQYDAVARHRAEEVRAEIQAAQMRARLSGPAPTARDLRCAAAVRRFGGGNGG